MARDDGEQQAMSDERLEAITRRFHVAAGMPVEATTQIERDALALLAEVERLRAREAALLAVVEDVARAFNLRSVIVVGREGPHCVATISRNAILQARALLASADSERSGGDGA